MRTKITVLFIAFAMALSSYAQDPGNCLNFYNILGHNFIAVGDIDDGLTQFTIETWMNPSADDAAAFICSHGVEHMEIHTSTGGNLRFIPTTGVFLDVPHAIALNKWTHVACTYNPNISEAHIYINGEEISYTLTGSLSTPIAQGSNNFIVGRRQNGAYPITGSMDEFRVWNVARSSEEIQSNFDKSVVPATEENLILYYKFNQGVAGGDNTLITTVTDLIGSYNGTLTNFQLTSGTSNFIESYAMVIPIAIDATSLMNTSFTANWQAPATGEFEEYHLYVATDENFTCFLAGYNPKIVAAGVLNEEIAGLSSDISYYYRVAAYNSLFAGQEALSNTIEAHTIQFILNPQIVQILQPEGSTATLEIITETEVEWSISELPNWLSSDIISGTGNGIITFTATENSSTENRNADFILSGTGITDLLFSVIQSYSFDNTLSFDGVDDYVSIGDDDNITAIDNMTAVTIETWVLWPEEQTQVGFICGKATGELEIHTFTGGGIRFIPTSNVFIDASAILPINRWTHLACVYDPAQLLAKIYINGKEVISTNENGTNPLSTPMESNTYNIMIGKRGNNSFPFKGSIDEFRIWNAARTQQEIQDDFAQALDDYATQSNLVAYYNFNQGFAEGNNTLVTELPDLKGNFNGILHNFAATGRSSNWVASYAMVIPNAIDATNVSNISFTANWQAPATGEFEEYHLYVATDENFTSFLAGYNPKIVAAGVLNEEIAGLSSDISYYYRVAAYNSLFAGQEALSNTIEAHTVQFILNPQIVQIAQPEGSTATLTITTGTEVEWSISELPNWLSSDINSGTGNGIITFTATENIANETRNAIVILSGTGMTDQMFNVMQSYSFGNALNFDGVDDYVQLLSTGEGFLGTNTLNESFTIEMMIRTTNTTANKALIAKHSNPGTRAGFFIIADANGTLRGGMANDANNWTSITSTKIINDDQWHHVAFVYDTIGATSTTYLYIDNVLQGSQTGFTAVFNNVVAAAIGSSLYYSSHQINASFDNLRLWNKARSAEDIYNRQFDILDSNEDGLIANYDFNQGVSCADNTGIDVLTDISANSNDVSLSNFALNTCVSNWVESSVFSNRYLSVMDDNIVLQNPASQAEIGISSNIAWEVTCSETWLSFSENMGTGNTTITLSAEENLNPNARTATAYVSGPGVAEKAIIITQKSVPPVAGELTFSTNFLGTQTRTHTDNVYELGEITSADALTGLTIEVIDGNINTNSTDVYYNAAIQGNMVYTGSDNVWYFSPTAAFVWSEGINTLTTQFIDNDGSTLDITVNFTLVQLYTLSFAVVGGNGSISADDGTNTLTSPADVANGTEITFTASPNSNYQVKEWIVNASPIVGNTTETYILTVDQNISVSVEFEPSVGVNNELSSTISVYPNPATNYLTIKNLDNETNFTITNITGQLIKSGITINNSIVISDLPEGIYNLSIEQSNTTIKIVFIKL